MDLIGWLALFAVCTVGIVLGGLLLVQASDRIAETTGLSRMLIGLLLVAAATSLPEIAVAVSAVLEGSPDLAIGNLLGSSMANMALLAMVDLVYRGRVWERVDPGHVRTGAVAIVLTVIVVLAIERPSGIAIGWVGIESIVIAAGFIGLVVWTRRSTRDTTAAPGPAADASGRDGSWTWPDIRTDVVRFVAGTGIILVAAPLVAVAADGIAATTGLLDTFVGASFLAVTTSLPELVTGLLAVRMGAFDLAVGALLGSNALNMAIVLVVDLAYLPGPVLDDVAPIETVVGLFAVLLMALVIACLVRSPDAPVRRTRYGPTAVVALYVFLMLVLWSAASDG
jgi:cation:H+ antiporter